MIKLRSDESYKKLASFYNSKILLWAIIMAGIVLHARQYIFNRSLWFDEAHLASCIISRTVFQLLPPMAFNLEEYIPTEPPGFLVVTKLVSKIFGNSEYALRLFPFLCGVAAIFLFYLAAKYFLEPKNIPVALGLFVISDRLIYFSSELAQYSCDVAIALFLYVLAINILPKKITFFRMCLFGIAGAITIWFSHPSLIILASIAACATLSSLAKKEWAKITKLTAVYFVWALSFIFFYLVALKKLSNGNGLMDFWGFAFLPLPPRNLSDFFLLTNTLFDAFKRPLGFHLNGIAVFAFIVGCISMFMRRKEHFTILLFPVLLTLLASGLHKYPFYDRLILFLIPFVLLLMAEGAGQITGRTKYDPVMIKFVFLALLFFHPMQNAYAHLVRPRTFEEIRPVIECIKGAWQEEDVIYLHHGSWYAFRYYAPRFGFAKEDYVIGSYSPNDYKKYMGELDRLHGNGKVWVLFSHVMDNNEAKFILNHLNNIGRRVASVKAPGSTAYLYNLRD